MGTDKLFTLREFEGANRSKKVGELDYIHAIFRLGSLPFDLALCFVELFGPRFVVGANRIFLKRVFDEAAYELHLSQGRTPREAQMWMNLVEITGLFEAAEVAEVQRLSGEIARIWNAQISREFPLAIGRARVISDDELGEVFITIDHET